MAIATYAEFETRMRRLHQTYGYKAVLTSRSGFSSAWRPANNPGAIPTIAEVCTKDTIGAYNYEDIPGNAGISQIVARTSINIGAIGGMLMLVDRLSHQGGLDATVTTPQTTNLPTAPLTRYTSGVGVWACIEIYTAVGTTSTTVTGSYTNHAGVPGRTFKDLVIGGANTVNLTAAQHIRPFSLQDGDLGVRSVESITLAGSTVSASGNFGVTLLKPLFINHTILPGAETYGTNTYNALIGGGGQFEPIQENACLNFLHYGSGAGTYTFAMSFMDIL